MAAPPAPNDSMLKQNLQKWFCAAVAASVAETVTFPLDVTKIRLQLQNELKRPLLKEATNGMIRTTLGIYREEGFRALWKGLTPAVMRQVLCGGIGVGLYAPVKEALMRGQQGAIPLSTKIIAGSVCGVMGQICASPTDVVKVRLQADARLALMGQTPRYRNTIDAFIRIPREEGFLAFGKGMLPSVQRAAVMYGASTATYDHAKVHVLRKTGLRADSVWAHVMSSCVSGLVAASVSTPFDVIKTRIINQHKAVASAAASAAAQTTTTTAAPAANTQLYKGPLDCLIKTVRTEGVLSLYKGFTPTYVRLAPWQLVFFVLFEQVSIAVTGKPFQAR